jgi:hypothetical protein
MLGRYGLMWNKKSASEDNFEIEVGSENEMGTVRDLELISEDSDIEEDDEDQCASVDENSKKIL